jgi:hypothetical protein
VGRLLDRRQVDCRDRGLLILLPEGVRVLILVYRHSTGSL